jgi:hypothetical protein
MNRHGRYRPLTTNSPGAQQVAKQLDDLLTRGHEQIGPSIEAVDRELRSASDATLERLASNEPDINANWEALTDAERRGRRAVNELARRARLAAQRQTEGEQEAAREAARAEAIAGEIASYKERARDAFPGTAAEFEQQWPELLAEWQRREMQRRLDREALPLIGRRGGQAEL